MNAETGKRPYLVVLIATVAAVGGFLGWQPLLLVFFTAPLLGSVAASIVDTAIFFSLAFAGSKFPWLHLAAGDLGVKLVMAGALLPLPNKRRKCSTSRGISSLRFRSGGRSNFTTFRR